MFLLIAMMAASQMAITMHLAALPALPDLLHTSQAMVQHTITLYLAAFALSQLFVGPLSDALGRRPMVIAGLGLFTIGSLAATFAPTVELLLVARVVQALGACAGIVLSRAIVRDFYTGKKAAAAQAYLAIAMALMPASAPFIGGILFVTLGWRSIFAATALTGAAVCVAATLSLTETLAREHRRKLHLIGLVRAYGELFGQRTYMVYSTSLSFLTASFNGYLAAIPMVLIAVMGVPEGLFGLFTLPTPIGFMVGNFVSSRLVRRHELDTLIRVGNSLTIGSALLFVAMTMAGLATPYTIALPLFIFFFGNGMILPNCLAGALNSVAPNIAGTASAFTGFIQMGFSAVATTILGMIAYGSAMPLGLTLIIAAALCAATFLFMPRSGAAASTRV